MIRKSRYIKIVPFNIDNVWEVVTNTNQTDWRSDLVRTEKVSDSIFREYFKTGGMTIFEITDFKVNQRYQFNMRHSFFSGVWSGKFKEVGKNETEINFYEQLDIKNPLIWLLSFIKLDLQKMQKQYVMDLEKELEKQSKYKEREFTN